MGQTDLRQYQQVTSGIIDSVKSSSAMEQTDFRQYGYDGPDTKMFDH